jgi:hypothetical protein
MAADNIHKTSLDDLEDVFQAITARAAGRATNEHVEDAVSRFVVAPSAEDSSVGLSASASKEQGSEEEEEDLREGGKGKEEDGESGEEEEESEEDDDDDAEGFFIEEDMENYDEEEPVEETPRKRRSKKRNKVDDEDGDEAAENPSLRRRKVGDPEDVSGTFESQSQGSGEKQARVSPVNAEESSDEEVEEVVEPKKRRGRPRKARPGEEKPKKQKGRPKTDWSVYENIPLGTQAAKMLTTFGDARAPRPETVSAVLDGTKLLIRAAMQDACRVREKNGAILKKARASFQQYRPKKPENKEEWSAEIMYKAMVRGGPSVGLFGKEELKTLYPEEMNVYGRWCLMREKAEKDKSSKVTTEDDGEEDNAATDGPGEEAPPSGHMEERAAQFDWRTDRMKKKWYLQFSFIRRGSFLGPVQNKGAHDSDDETGRWARLPPVYAQFLHWAGFDPQSPDPLPNNATTDALAFLAYNFFGRIVEKAVYLRNLEKKLKSNLNEITKGESLEAEDIARAMDDPDIKPTPVFEGSKVGTQLYFGPGFEDRLELEMEEMLKSASHVKKDASADDLFAHLASTEPASTESKSRKWRKSSGK